MRCPYCTEGDSRVIDSRELEQSVRRRRECLRCGARFTTYERPETVRLMVVKKDGRREEFEPHKLMDGIRKACAKRPVSTEDIEQVVGEIESELVRHAGSEVPSQLIGEIVMNRLRELDEVAYVRFASVYRQFKDVDSLAEEIADLKEWKRRALQDKVQPRLIT